MRTLIAINGLLAVLFFVALKGVEASGDTLPPVLVYATADSWQLDTSQAEQTLTITLHITDDLSGVDYTQITYVHINGYNTYRTCDVWAGADGVIDWSIECDIQFPRYSAEGSWQVFSVFMQDRVGNRIETRTSDCERWSDGRCQHYVYTEDATPLIRSMEIQIGENVLAPLLYLPLIASP